MKIKTKYLGTIDADVIKLSRLAGVIEDAAKYNHEKHYIKVHGDLMEEARLIRSKINDTEPYRNISAASQDKRRGRAKKVADSDK